MLRSDLGDSMHHSYDLHGRPSPHCRRRDAQGLAPPPMYDGSATASQQGCNEFATLGCSKCRWAVRGCGRCRGISPGARRIERQRKELKAGFGRRNVTVSVARGPPQLEKVLTSSVGVSQ